MDFSIFNSFSCEVLKLVLIGLLLGLGFFIKHYLDLESLKEDILEAIEKANLLREKDRKILSEEFEGKILSVLESIEDLKRELDEISTDLRDLGKSASVAGGNLEETTRKIEILAEQLHRFEYILSDVQSLVRSLGIYYSFKNRRNGDD